MPGFDFQALAARPRADNPDTELFDLLEADRTHSKRCDQACKGQRRAVQAEIRDRFWHERRETEKRLCATRPATLEGLLAKLRHAFGLGRRGPARVSSLRALEHAAALDAAARLEGRGLLGAPTADAGLFEAIATDKAAERRFAQEHDRFRRQSYRRGGDAVEPGDAWRRAAEVSREARKLVAATRPATLEGLTAKLRHATKGMHRCPASDVQHATLLDVIAWLKPRKRRGAKARAQGLAEGVGCTRRRRSR